MFIVDEQKYWVEAKPENVVYLASSVNRPVVVLPGKNAQPAQVYVAIVYSPPPKRGYETFIFLHCILSNEGLLYKWDAGPVAKDQAGALQKEALGFGESRGFMMSDLRWRGLDAQARQEMFDSIPMFFQDLSRFKEEVEEEVLEIEPAEDDELVVESVEEPAETVTEGDFVITEDSFAEPKPGERVEDIALGELPDLDSGKAGQAAAGASGASGAGPSEEDLLLDSLEVKEAPGAPAGSPDKDMVLDFEESEAEEQAPAPAQPDEEEVRISIEEEHPGPVAACGEFPSGPSLRAELSRAEPSVEEVRLEAGVGPAGPSAAPVIEEEVVANEEPAAARPGPSAPGPDKASPTPLVEIEEELEIPFADATLRSPALSGTLRSTREPASPEPVIERIVEDETIEGPVPASAVGPAWARAVVSNATLRSPALSGTLRSTSVPSGGEDLELAIRFLVMF